VRTYRKLTYASIQLIGPSGVSADALEVLSYLRIPDTCVRMRGFLQPAKKYFDALAMNRKKSPLTIVNYARDLDNFLLKFLWNHRQLDIGPSNVDEELGTSYSKWLMDQGAAPATQFRRIVSLRRLFAWFTANRVISRNVMQYLESPEVPENLPRPFKDDELLRLFQACPTYTFTGIRDLLALELMYGSGARCGELSHIRFRDIDLHGFDNQAFVTLFGKGRKSRLVPMSRQCVEAYNKYLQLRGPGSSDDYVMLNTHGRRLTAQAFQAQMKIICDRADVEDGGSHRLRHSFATHMLANGCPLEVLAELMGHASLDTTVIYTKIAPVKAFEAYRKANIRNLLRNTIDVNPVQEPPNLLPPTSETEEDDRPAGDQ
jgi:site-specific recombinase XerD